MKLDIKELLSQLKLKTSRVPSGREGSIFLYRDWKWLVISLLSLSVLVLAFGFYVFYQASYEQKDENGNTTSPIENLSRAKLQGVIDAYSAKEVQFTNRKNSKPSVPNL